MPLHGQIIVKLTPKFVFFRVILKKQFYPIMPVVKRKQSLLDWSFPTIIRPFVAFHFCVSFFGQLPSRKIALRLVLRFGLVLGLGLRGNFPRG